jgi:hypothetical protein
MEMHISKRYLISEAVRIRVSKGFQPGKGDGIVV